MCSLGTLSDATTNENPNTSAAKSCSNGYSGSDYATEVFDFNPELCLASPAIVPPNDDATHNLQFRNKLTDGTLIDFTYNSIPYSG